MAERTYSPKRALGLSEKPYESYFEEDVRSPAVQFSYTPDRGYSAAPMMMGRSDAYENKFNELDSRAALERLAAQKDIITGKTDWVSPEGQQKRLDYLMKGAITPQQEYAIERSSRPETINKYSQVPAEVVKATSPLEHIDPTDPKAWERMTSVLAQMDADEALGGTDIKAHPYFRDTLNDLKRSILTMRRASPEDRDDRLWYAMQGGDPAEYDKGLFKTPEGTQDRAQMAYRIAQMKRQPSQQLSALEARQLEEAFEQMGQMSDSKKVSAFRAASGRDPVTAEDWKLAWNLANEELAPSREGLADIIRDLETQGKMVPGRYKEAAGILAPQENAPRGTNENQSQLEAPTQGERILVKTLEEWQALSPGTKYIDSKGRPGTKK